MTPMLLCILNFVNSNRGTKKLNSRKYIILCVFYFLLYPALSHIECNPCSGLVLSSGGSRGSYHAGAIKGLTSVLPSEEVRWDFISGISAGAINTLSALLFKIGQENEWADYLIDMWSTIKSNDVYNEWTFRELEGLLMKSGIYDNSPLKTFLTDKIYSATNGTGNFTTDRKIIVSATRMNDGSQISWNEKVDMQTLINAVIASSTIPAVFPVAIVDGDEFTDGSVFSAVNIQAIIDRCMVEKNSHPTEVTIDIILCTPIDLKDCDLIFSNQNSLHILLRTSYLSTYINTKLMMERAQLRHPEVQFRFVIAPEQTIENSGLDFDYKNLKDIMEQGYQDAIEVSKNYMSNLFKKELKIADL